VVDRKSALVLTAVVLTFLVLLGLLGSAFVVQQTEQALVLQFGEVVGADKKPILGPGLHFKVPLIQNVVYFDSRVLGVETEQREVIAADQKRLVVDAYAKYRIVDPLKFLQSVRSEHNLRVRVSSIMESAERQEIAKCTLNCLLSDCRKDVDANITRVTSSRAEAFGVQIIGARIRRVSLPVKNAEAIFQRMQTEREKEAREIRAFGSEEEQIVRSEADKERRMLLSSAKAEAEAIRGSGDAEAIAIYNAAFKVDRDFFRFYHYMRMYKNVLSGSNSAVVLGSDNDLFKFLLQNRGQTKTTDKVTE
jgi:membrane protease subunit HflC